MYILFFQYRVDREYKYVRSNTGWTENTNMSDLIQGGQRIKVSDPIQGGQKIKVSDSIQAGQRIQVCQIQYRVDRE